MQVHPISDGNSADASELDDPGIESGQSSSKYSSRQRYYFLTSYIFHEFLVTYWVPLSQRTETGLHKAILI